MINPLLSIITPVYNVKTYIDRCIESILTQSYSHIELILIDDGSTDGSSAICDEWSKKDERIIVIHKSNGGVSSARNAGLEVVKGDYLTFVDPDDFLEQDTYLSNMEYLVAHQDVDILQYPYCHYVSENEIPKFHKPHSILLMGVESIFENWWSGSPLEYVIWNKIYKRGIWDGIRFKVGHISEDTSLVPFFVNRAKSVYISEKGLYYYQRAREDSYTYGSYSFDNNIDLFNAHTAIYECFNQFPCMITEKVLAFTRLYRRLIAAKQTEPTADISEQLVVIKQYFPSWLEILQSRNTEKLWLLSAKTLGSKIFLNLFLRYLKK